MRLISWNTAHKTKKRAEQVEELLARNPDVVALQEILRSDVSKDVRPNLRERFKGTNLCYVVDSFQLAGTTGRPKGPRQYGELIASRFPLYRSRLVGTTWPERALCTFIKTKTPIGSIQFLTTGIPPGSSNHWIKIDVLKGIYAELAHDSQHPRILCGDFNTPKEELHDGRIVTWVQYMKGDEVVTRKKFRGKRGEAWDQGERDILEGLERFGLVEVYRRLHGNRVSDFSWFARTKQGKQGRRFDHIFASVELPPTRCEYLHEFRVKKKLSDHSPIEADFQLT